MTGTKYSVSISEEYEDADWDVFLEKTPGGDHLQTSLWAQVKASLGWRPIRLVVRSNGSIIAGAQILVRDTPIVGTMGCVAKGPVFAHDDPSLITRVTDELQQIARDYSLHNLCVQPSRTYATFPDTLQKTGFHSSSFRLIPPATTQLDLSKSLDDILMQMKSRTRYNVRRSARKGITIRHGTSDDVETYYRLMLQTTRRKQFAAFPRRYYKDMWRILNPRGYLHLLVAEYGGETVSSLMLITFGNAAENKLGVWSGRHGDKRPNDAIHWAATKLARSLGHRYYDLGGITLSAAEAVLQGKPVPDAVKQTVTSFKLDFGGEVFLYPGASDFQPSLIYRWAFNEFYSKLHKYKSVKRAFNWLRTHPTLTKF